MTRRSEPRNVPASVHARLRNLAHRRKVDFNLLLDRYAAERFLYRLSASPEVDRFTLKGAALFRVWTEDDLRQTRDVDFLSVGSADHLAIRAAMETVCSIPCPEDGVVFDAETIRIRDMRRGRPEGGLRARIQGHLGNIRLALQVDIGFGDTITPAREQEDYPTLLDLPPPRIWTYPRETMVAEKFEAMVSLGVDNSRVTDLWDIALVARRFAFDGETLQTAVAATFRQRQTSLGDEWPDALLPAYYEDSLRTERWRSLGRQIGMSSGGPTQLVDVGEELRCFLAPVCDSLIENSPLTQAWPPGGPWRSGMQVWAGGNGGG